MWAAIIVAFAAFQVCLWLVARTEQSIVQNENLKHWSVFSGASWYTFGTLIGESITRDTHSEGAWGMRLCIGVWLLAAFLLTAGYGGNLRAFLMNPPLDDPIDSLEGVLASGLPWEMGIYGEDVEMDMAQSEHPTMKAIWDGKIPVLSEKFGFKRVAKVSEGRTVLIDWKNKLETSIFIGFTLPDGRSLIDRYELPIVYSKVENVHAFHPLNPWVERYDGVVLRCVDAGLVLMFWDAVRRNLKAEYGTDEYLPENLSPWSEIVVGDLLGLNVFFVSFLALSLVLFAVEAALGRARANTRALQQ